MELAWMIGLAGSGIIALAAFAKRALSASGALAAMAMGTLMYALGSAAWYGALIAFFISSTLLSKYKKRRKARLEADYAKTGRRDAGQVLANGGVALLFCLLYAAAPSAPWWAAFVGSLAAANADTWATELGALSRRDPRSILTGRRVPKGTSGGVSALGLFASALGGLFIGLAAWLLLQASAGQLVSAAPQGLWPLVALGLIGGMAGSLADSAIGARWQAMHVCAVCGRAVEVASHCGQPASAQRGLPWLGNDGVNALGTLAGGTAALLAGLLL